MYTKTVPSHMLAVALRKESVDRNLIQAVGSLLIEASLSVRRAWIEISADPT